MLGTTEGSAVCTGDNAGAADHHAGYREAGVSDILMGDLGSGPG